MLDAITGTNHTSFTVADLSRAISLFCDGLGFVLTSRAGRDPGSIQTITGVAGADVEMPISTARPTVELSNIAGRPNAPRSRRGLAMSALPISRSTSPTSTR